MYAAPTDSPTFADLRLPRPAVPRPRFWRWRWHIFGVVAVALLAAGYGRLATEDRATPVSIETVTVAPGDTLWGIAARRYPAADPREKVVQIERVNSLDGPVIEPGQRLRLPAG